MDPKVVRLCESLDDLADFATRAAGLSGPVRNSQEILEASWSSLSPDGRQDIEAELQRSIVELYLKLKPNFTPYLVFIVSKHGTRIIELSAPSARFAHYIVLDYAVMTEKDPDNLRILSAESNRVDSLRVDGKTEVLELF